MSALLYWGATYLQTYLVGWVGQRALQDLRLRIFTHLQRQSIGFFSRRKTGVLMYESPVLPYGPHTIEIRVADAKNPEARYTWVNVDHIEFE